MQYCIMTGIIVGLSYVTSFDRRHNRLCIKD